jgi:hypothetical protein
MPRILPALLGAASVLAVAAWLAVALLRIGHPFELEWQEGGMLAHVARVRAGQALYAEPALDFVAYPYPPLYVWVAALAGESFLALRAVSLAATLALLALLFQGARRASGSTLAGLAAAGVYAAGFRFAGAWFDAGRNDALALALALGALEVLRGARLRGALLAGCLAGLAVLTKQNMALPACALGGALALRDRRLALAFFGAASAVAGGVSLWIELASDGWYRFYVWDLLREQPLDARAFLLGSVVPLAPLAALAAAARLRRARVPEDRLLLAAALGLVCASVLARASIGGYDNTLMPALLAGALLAGDGIGRAAGAARQVAAGLCVAQLGLLAYDPRAAVPSAADVAAGEALVQELAALEGGVLLPAHPYLLERAGKPGSLHLMALMDLSASDAGLEHAQRLTAELDVGFARRRWEHVILGDWDRMEHVDPPEREALRAFFEAHLALRRRLFVGAPEDLFVPVTGARQRPELVYGPR